MINEIKIENMKNLANYIIDNMIESSDWNEKFYQKNDGTVEIYISNEKHDVTGLFNSNLNSDGMFVRSEFNSEFTSLLEKMIDNELDNL